MSAGGCFPGGTVSEDDRKTGKTLCHTAARIPPAVQVSVTSKMLGPLHPHKPSNSSHKPLTHSPLTEGTLMPASPSRQCCS